MDVLVVDHPLVQGRLTALRDRHTEPGAFRAALHELTTMLVYEATRRLPVERYPIETPVAPTEGVRAAKPPLLVPVLRAGLGMAEAMLQALPEASVWHLGLYRDHATLKPVTYYNKLPPKPEMDVGIVLDPMLATGGSAIAAIDILRKAGTPRVVFAGLIAAPEGVAALQAAHPEVPIFLAALDSHLNEVGYIVPGLGDAGDRQFATD